MSPKQTSTAKRSPATKQPGAQRPAPSGSFDPLQERRLKELAGFKKKHGHCDVPRKYPPNPPIAHWVVNIRRRKNSGAIDPELVRRLDRLGFSWSVSRRKVRRLDWDKMVAALANFKEQHGHFRVPSKHRQLAWWLAAVRHKRRRGLLNLRRVRQLDELGLVWEPWAQHWEEMFSALVRYMERHGNCEVPINYPDNPQLGRWVNRQLVARRREELKQANIERLDEIGFTWGRQQHRWNLMYAALTNYKKIHGHCRVSRRSWPHRRLGLWVRTQRVKKRRGTLTAEQIRRLEHLGFVWDDKQERWEEMYLAFVEYRENHGHCDVPTRCPENPKLGNWVVTQRADFRKGVLLEERVARLTAIGFLWRVRREQ